MSGKRDVGPLEEMWSRFTAKVLAEFDDDCHLRNHPIIKSPLLVRKCPTKSFAR